MTPKGECSAFRSFERSSPSTVRRSLGTLLLEELYSFVGEGWEQEDDITLLTLRHSVPLS